MKRVSLNTQILIGCLAGIAGGFWLAGANATPAAQNVLYGAKLAGNLFLDLLRMVLVPLVFSSIVVGVANLRAHDQMHRVWTTTLAFFFATMGLAILIGFGAAHIFRPGDGLQLEMFAAATKDYQARQMPLPDYIAQFLRGLFQNPFKALARARSWPSS
jgi:Na+/H+-dicarboxylate symporter